MLQNAFVGNNSQRSSVDGYGFQSSSSEVEPVNINDGGSDINASDSENLKPAQNSHISLIVLLGLYILWGIMQNQSLKDQVKAGTIKANFSNLVMSVLTIVVGVNFLNVLFTKLIKWNIPIVSKVAGSLLPLVRF